MPMGSSRFNLLKRMRSASCLVERSHGSTISGKYYHLDNISISYTMLTYDLGGIKIG